MNREEAEMIVKDCIRDSTKMVNEGIVDYQGTKDKRISILAIAKMLLELRKEK